MRHAKASVRRPLAAARTNLNIRLWRVNHAAGPEDAIRAKARDSHAYHRGAVSGQLTVRLFDGERQIDLFLVGFVSDHDISVWERGGASALFDEFERQHKDLVQFWAKA